MEYLLEGSFQKSGDNVRLIVQLIRADQDEHIWANEYDRNWKDIFTVQSEVAQTIARELDAVITPEEKQVIEIIPTTSLAAYDYYQKGSEEFWNFTVTYNFKSLDRAKESYKKAFARRRGADEFRGECRHARIVSSPGRDAAHCQPPAGRRS